jgi:hypothetical protein
LSENTLNDQVRAYLSDAHSIEEQALAQLRSAPDHAGDESLAEALRTHRVTSVFAGTVLGGAAVLGPRIALGHLHVTDGRPPNHPIQASPARTR